MAVAFVSGVLKANDDQRSLRPRRGHADTALVGLLTPELVDPAFSPSTIGSADEGGQWLFKSGPTWTLGYSGGAVPDSHRVPCFRRPHQAGATDHQRTISSELI